MIVFIIYNGRVIMAELNESTKVEPETITGRDVFRDTRRKIINFISAGILFVILVITVEFVIAAVQGFSHTTTSDFLLYYSAFGTVAVLAAAYALNRSGRSAAAGWVLVVSIIVMTCYADPPMEIADGRGLFYFSIPIFMASFVIAPWASGVAAGLSALGIAALAIQSGERPNEINMLGFGLLALVSWLAARQTESALRASALANRRLELSQAAISESEKKYRSLFETSPEVITIIDMQGRVIDCNSAAVDMIGEEKENIVGASVLEPGIMDRQSAARVKEALSAIADTGHIENVGIAVTGRDGAVFHLEINASAVAFGDDGGYIQVIARDVTARKTAERKLEEAHDIINRGSAAGFIWRIENGRPVDFVTDNVMSLFGYRPSEFMQNGLLYSDIIAPEYAGEIEAGIDRSAMNPERTANVLEPYIIFTKDGRKRWVRERHDIRRDEKGEATHLLGIVEDITKQQLAREEQGRLEDQLRQAQKMEIVGQLAGGVAHDFNNMLAVIIGNTEIVMSDMHEKDPRRDDLQDVLDAAVRSKDLSMKLLTFSRKEKLHVRKFDAGELITGVVSVLERSFPKLIRLETDVEPGMLIRGDDNQLYQTLLNLCNNARDAMPGGGTLRIAAESVEFDGIVCPGCSEKIAGRFCSIRVSDTGEGIPAEYIDKVIEPFFTTKSVGKGTGLGLSTSLGIVRSHAGHMWISSRPGEGTEITILIPYDDTLAAGKGEESQKVVHEQGSGTILVVDDEELVLGLADRLIRNAGYTSITAGSGAKAIEIFKKEKQGIDLVIMDIMMPEMDGRELFYELKKIDGNVKIILSSGYSDDGVASELMRNGAVAFLQKPFKSDLLYSTISEAMRGGVS